MPIASLNEVQLANELRLVAHGVSLVGGSVGPQRSAARERTATPRARQICRSPRCALNEVQLANELRLRHTPTLGPRSTVTPQRSAARERTATQRRVRDHGRHDGPSTKCSSRTNCDQNRAHTGSETLPVPSTKCSSRTNCDVGGSGALAVGDVVPQRSAARERTATLPLPPVHSRQSCPSTKCSSRTNCDPLDRLAVAVDDPHPSTKCSSRTNCDSGHHHRGALLPPTLNEVQLANELRPRCADSYALHVLHPQRSAARERTATWTHDDLPTLFTIPQRSAARERTATE